MSHSATNSSPMLPKTHAPHWLFRLIAHLWSIPSTTEQAYSQRRDYDHQPDATFRDAGQSRDDATGLGSHQPELPFFLQSGFGKR